MAQFLQDMFLNAGKYFYFGVNFDWATALWIPLNYVYKDYLNTDEDRVVLELIKSGVGETVAHEFVDYAYINVQRVGDRF